MLLKFIFLIFIIMYLRYSEQFNVIYKTKCVFNFFLDYDNIFYTNIKNSNKICFNLYYLYITRVVY